MHELATDKHTPGWRGVRVEMTYRPRALGGDVSHTTIGFL